MIITEIVRRRIGAPHATELRLHAAKPPSPHALSPLCTTPFSAQVHARNSLVELLQQSPDGRLPWLHLINELDWDVEFASLGKIKDFAAQVCEYGRFEPVVVALRVVESLLRAGEDEWGS